MSYEKILTRHFSRLYVVSFAFYLAKKRKHLYNKDRTKGGLTMAVTFYYNNSKIQIFKIISVTLDGIIQMHSHAKSCYEIHLIDDGKGILETADGTYPLHKNSLYITGPNVAHKQISDACLPMHELCVYLKISPQAKDEVIHFFASQPFWIGESNDAVNDVFRQITARHRENVKWNECIISSLAIRLIAEIANMYAPEAVCQNDIFSDGDLNESRSWILDRLLTDEGVHTSLDEIASRMGVCRRQAQRIIQEQYGTSYKTMQYEARMAMAASLLEQESLSLEKCAALCGYASAASFVAAFKRKYKTTPKKYRETIETKSPQVSC